MATNPNSSLAPSRPPSRNRRKLQFCLMDPNTDSTSTFRLLKTDLPIGESRSAFIFCFSSSHFDERRTILRGCSKDLSDDRRRRHSLMKGQSAHSWHTYCCCSIMYPEAVRCCRVPERTRVFPAGQVRVSFISSYGHLSVTKTFSRYRFFCSRS